MKNENFKEFKEKMLAIGEMYNKTLSDSLLDIYWTTLSNISIDDFVNGINQHVLDPEAGAFFPKPANIISKLKQSQKDIDSKNTDLANLAWEQIMLIAGGRRVEITDMKALAAIRAQGGIERLGLTNYEALVWVKRDFIASYVMYGRTPANELPQHLSELIEEKQISNKSSFKKIGLH